MFSHNKAVVVEWGMEGNYMSTYMLKKKVE